ncbi:MAG: transporter substrate-binding domain-containing protein [Rickettsiales bacterium]|nr:transporter substrate-binding domain-containing protein [Rickettsiales bacterium]
MALPVNPAYAIANPKKKLVIAADIWCPINCNPTSSQLGIGIDLVKYAFKGYDVEYRIMPWSQALEEVRRGTVDAVVGANSSDEPKLIFPENPLAAITDDFYTLSSNKWTFKDVSSLEGKRLGVIADYGYGPEITAYIKKYKGSARAVQSVSGDEALPHNIKKLFAKDIDILVESKIVMDYTIKNMGLQESIRRAGGVKQGYVYVGFSPVIADSHKRAQQYDEAVEKLKSSNRLLALYSEYGITNE